MVRDGLIGQQEVGTHEEKAPKCSIHNRVSRVVENVFIRRTTHAVELSELF